MAISDPAFLAELRATFEIEAREHLQTISDGIIALERESVGARARETVETVFRAAHSLKGAARAVDLGRVESLCALLEETFAAWKRGQAPTPDMLESVHKRVDAIGAAIAEKPAPETRPPAAAVHAPVPQPAPARSVEPPAQAAAAPPSVPPAIDVQETVRIPLRKLQAQFRESQELLSLKLAAIQRSADLEELTERLEAWRDAWPALEPDARLSRLRSIEDLVARLRRAADRDRYAAGRLTDDFLEESRKLLALPFGTISATFPKIVRDLAHEQGKDVDFTMRGEDVEIDRRILEEVKDPIVHLLRNCVDHGIEPPAERTRSGKRARAAIALTVARVSANRVELTVSDDGRGIDAAAVRKSAVDKGAITADEAARLTDAQARALIFESDVSTSATVTQVSGRGLGLAIVKERAEKLGGRVALESEPGSGTTFRFGLPVAVAAFRGVLVDLAGHLVVLPTSHVERVIRTRPQDVKSVEGRDTVAVDGRALALVELLDVLELPALERREAPAGGRPAVVLASGEQRVAFAVDAVMGEQEVLLKRLSKPLLRVRNVAAATVLGSGRIAPVLNPNDLLKSARTAAAARSGRAATPAPAAARTKNVLVADDSITSRMLLKTILESAGYKVSVAVDGMDALTQVRAESFDLLVSDVEMPRLTGFDLTARIRAEPRLASLPVILVTALGTREDRERGIDAGANAYIVKSNFDQGDLMAAVRRLI